MAKVIGPLFSLDARCSLGKAITYMKRGSVIFVRKVFKPAQTWSKSYIFQKNIHGGCSKAVARIERGWIYHDEVLKIGFEKADFQAQIIGALKNTYFKTEEDLKDLWTEYVRHPSEYYFRKGAKQRGFQDYNVSGWEPKYGFGKGFQMYILAKFAFSIRSKAANIFQSYPYNIEFEDWNEVDIIQHAQRVRQV